MAAGGKGTGVTFPEPDPSTTGPYIDVYSAAAPAPAPCAKGKKGGHGCELPGLLTRPSAPAPRQCPHQNLRPLPKFMRLSPTRSPDLLSLSPPQHLFPLL